MKSVVYYTAGHSPSLACAAAILKKKGCLFTDQPDRAVTHLLLDAPQKDWQALPELLPLLPPDIAVLGGNLAHPCLAGYQKIDLLEDAYYLAHNANITAHCAVKLALSLLPVILEGCPVLVIGSGRIGKCLAALLQRMGADVTIAARKEQDRAMLSALGFRMAQTGFLGDLLPRYRLIFNTVPALILPENILARCSRDCVKIELASKPGMLGSDVIDGRGLPGKLAPETSGELIAETILRFC